MTSSLPSLISDAEPQAIGRVRARDGCRIDVLACSRADDMTLVAHHRTPLGDRLTRPLTRALDRELHSRAKASRANVAQPTHEPIPATPVATGSRTGAQLCAADRRGLAAALLEQLELLWNAGLVLAHLDLHTVVVWGERPWLVDLRAAARTSHPLAEGYRRRAVAATVEWGTAPGAPPLVTQFVTAA